MNFSLWGEKYSRSIDSKGNYIYSHIYIDRYFKHLKKGNYCVTAASVKNKNINIIIYSKKKMSKVP